MRVSYLGLVSGRLVVRIFDEEREDRQCQEAGSVVIFRVCGDGVELFESHEDRVEQQRLLLF